MDNNVVMNLINTIIEDNRAATWDDNSIVKKLLDCGLTKEDLIQYGFEDFITCYYDDSRYEYVPSAENGDYSPSNPWDAPGMKMSDFI